MILGTLLMAGGFATLGAIAGRHYAAWAGWGIGFVGYCAGALAGAAVGLGLAWALA